MLYYQINRENRIVFEQLKTANFNVKIITNSNIDTCNIEIAKVPTINSYVISDEHKIFSNVKNVGLVNEIDMFLHRSYIEALNIIIVIDEKVVNLYKTMFPTKQIYTVKEDLVSLLEEIISPDFLNVIIQFYKISNEERKKEIINAVMMNLNNHYVKKVYNLSESETTEVPLEISNHKKFVNVPISKWAGEETKYKWYTFNDVFKFCNETLKNKYCCLMNLDIGLDSETKWDKVKSSIDNNYVFALSRHEYNTKKMDEEFSKLFHCHTQDVWIFKTPLVIENCDFEIGLLGADNAIADRLRKSGKQLYNKSKEFKVYHFDVVRGKTSSNFLEHHATDNEKIQNKNPEKNGCFLLPCYEDIIDVSLDKIVAELNVDKDLKYDLICQIFSKKIQINN